MFWRGICLLFCFVLFVRWFVDLFLGCLFVGWFEFARIISWFLRLHYGKSYKHYRVTQTFSHWWSLFITLTRSKIAASIASLWISVQLFCGGRRIIKLDSWDDPQKRHVDSIANSPVRVASIVVGALVWAETCLGVAFMFACLKRWQTVKFI